MAALSRSVQPGKTLQANYDGPSQAIAVYWAVWAVSLAEHRKKMCNAQIRAKQSTIIMRKKEFKRKEDNRH